MRAPDRLLDGAWQLALGLGEARRLVHGFVPGLLLRGNFGRGRAGAARPATGGHVHDFAGAGGIGARRCVGAGVRILAVAIPVVGVRLRQAVIGLFDADAVPGLGVGREGEPRVPQQPVGDQLGGALPARRVARGPRRVWCLSAQARTTLAIAVSMKWASVSAIHRGE